MYKFYEEINGELSPLSDTTVIQEIKNQLLYGKTYAYIKVLGTDLILTEQNYVKNFDISELRFVPDNGVFGQCVAKKLDINIYNEDMQFTLQDKELEVYLKVIYNDNNYYIKYGTFIVQKPENETTIDNTSFTALDYMIKFNQKYVNTITYPCTLRQLASNICAQLGITLAEESFRNENFSVENNQFTNGETYRNVLQGIAMSAFSWARIDENNVLHFDLNKKQEQDETIDYDGYFTLNKQDLNYGPLNRIIIRESEIEGENVTIEDAESIAEYGVTELVISDNPFAYTQEKREALIQAASSLFGFTYMPINEVSLIGYAYLDSTSKIRFKTLQDTYIDTYLFNHIISYNGATLDKMEAPALTKTETLYAYKPEISESVKRTEIMVDKQNQIIEAVIENVSEQDTKITQLRLDVDEIKSEIQDIADVTESKESETATVSIDNVNESEPVRIEVHPIVTNISLIYPRNNLYPNNNLYMPIRTIRFTRTYIEEEETKTQNIDYELPMDLLYYDADNYDEFILDYGGQSCTITKKVAYNADGTTYVMQNPQTIELEYPTIELLEGNYTISILGYTQGYIFARLMIKNLYTDQFATKAQLNSAITQTKSEVDISVNQKLTNYSTTNEMNSAIDIKAGQITQSVSETYETKSNASSNYSTLNNKAQNAQNTADGINTNLTTNYYTKSQTNSQITQKANEINQSVSETYETKSASASNIAAAKQEAITSANNSTDTKLTNYSTTSQMNSAINQKANEITSSVSTTYETKTDSVTHIATAKSEAIASSNATTDTKLTNYSTTTQMNSAINQKANEITAGVSQTYITKTQSASDISTAKSEAISSANSSTDSKLENYSTTSQMNEAIGDAVEDLVDNEELSTVIQEQSVDFSLALEQAKTEVQSSTTGNILTLLNNGYLTAEQVNALVNGNTEDITTIKQQLTQTITNSQMQIAIQTAISGGVSYLKNTLFTINDEGLWIATNQDEFNAQYNNRGMYLKSYNNDIAKFDVDGSTIQGDLIVEGEIRTSNLKIVNATVGGEKHTHIHWIGG